MSVAYDHRPFSVDSPYAPVGEHGHEHDDDDADQDMNKYINTEANVDDMADLAAATYDPDEHDHHHHHHDHHHHHSVGDAPSPFKVSDSPAATTGPTSLNDLDPPVGSPIVDPANESLRVTLPTPPRLGLGLDSRAVGARRPSSSSKNNNNTNTSRFSHSPSPRSKPIEKPSRVVTKNEAGMFECSFKDCKEELRMFARKCEWR